MLIATAGHIDHGKTALVRALSGVETDRLPEEKARGMSIDLGFAYWQPDDGPVVGFVDVPGHERFVRNMLAGLIGIDFALLVVAADDGLMPQTIEHLRMVDLLGISRGVVALTKTDRVDGARLAEVSSQIARLLAPSTLAGAPIFPVSSLTGEGIADLAAALLGEREAKRSDPDHHFRLAIDRAFSVTGAGTVVTGTVLAGHANVGDALCIAPTGREFRMRGMESAGRKVETIGPGQRAAFNLAGIEVGEIHRGDWLVAPAAYAPTSRMEALVTLLADCLAPLRHDSQVHLHIGAADITARVLVPRQRSLIPGAETLVQLVLDRPTSALSGDRFVLRDPSGRELLGGGMVLDPLASTRRPKLAEREARAAALAVPEPAAKLAALASAPGLEPDTRWFAQSCNLKADGLAAMLSAGHYQLAGKTRTIAIAADRFARIGDALTQQLEQHHLEHPDLGGMPRRLARAALGEPVSADLFASLLSELTGASRIEVQGALLRIPGHAAMFNQVEIDFWRKVLRLMDDSTPKPMALAELARELRTGEASVAAMLQRRRASGDVWQVTTNKFMLREQVAALATLAARLDNGAGFTAAELRDASGMGRNFTIQLLEFFDRIGLTRRSGERRRMRADWAQIT
jgi:selenocysteine-specific elongation factor